MKLYMKIFAFLVLFLNMNVANVFATCTAASCDPTLTVEEIDLRDNSIFGHLLQRIVLTNCCTNDTDSSGNIIPNLKIVGLGSPPADGGPVAMSVYTPYTLTPGQTVALRNITGDTTFTRDLSLASVTLKAEWREAACPTSSTCRVKLCLTVPSSTGNPALKCKAYSNINPSTNPVAAAAVSSLTEAPEVCRIVASSCDNTTVSQSIFSFSGPAVQCLTDTLRQNFFVRQPGCVLADDTQANVNMSFLASFASFQEALKVSVRALLILYTMGFGMKMLLNQSEFSAEAVVQFIMKMILVGYFAVGWGPAYFQDGIRQTENGTMKWALPILTQMTSDMASITFAASTGSRGLCEFDNSRYPRGYGYYGLFDRIDCKLGAYLLLKKIYGFGFRDRSTFPQGWRKIPVTYPLHNSARPESDTEVRSAAGVAEQFGIFVLIFGLFLGGQFLVFIALIYFMAIVLSILLGFISLYTVCLVTLHVMVYLSPIFVPMALFERTKSYFDSWVKVTLSCALQPMVLATFLAMVMSLYDEVFFGTCEFKRHDYTNGTEYRSVYEIRIPDTNRGECLFSTGYVLISYIFGLGGESYGAILFTIDMVKDVANIWLNCIMLLIFSYIMRFFMSGLYTFASDITGGLNVSGVTVDMRKIADTIKAGIDKGYDKLSQPGGGSKAGPDRKGGDKGGGDGPSMDGGGGDKGGGSPSMDGGGGKSSDA